LKVCRLSVEVPVAIIYRDATIDCAFRLNFRLDRKVMPELKAVDSS